MRIHAVLTCFNRRETTELCLTTLRDQRLPEGTFIHLYIVDDGSTDGTFEMLRDRFPKAELMRGSGSLFWCGGMRVAWHAAAQNDPDYFLLLNDDTPLDPNALTVLLETAGAPDNRRIAVGAVRDPATGQISYGGVKTGCGNFPPAGQTQSCNTFNANAVLIPRAVFREMGVFCEAYTHAMGDFDYGFQARRLGIEIIQTPCFVGSCTRNPMEGSWRDRSLTRIERLKILRSPKGLPLREWIVYNRRNYGWRWPLYSLSPYIRVLLGL